MSKLLDLLLRPETPDVQKELPRGRYELLRLSELYGEPFVLELKAVPYGRALELKEMPDVELQTVLAGDDSGLWKSGELQERFGGAGARPAAARRDQGGGCGGGAAERLPQGGAGPLCTPERQAGRGG